MRSVEELSNDGEGLTRYPSSTCNRFEVFMKNVISNEDGETRELHLNLVEGDSTANLRGNKLAKVSMANGP